MRNFWQEKRVLITGHTGFKGSWLAFWLSRLGAKVGGLSLAPDTDPNLFENLALEARITSVIGDIRDLALVEKTLNDLKPEVVFHLAAQSLVRRSYREPLETYTTNVIGTINILEAIRKFDFVRSVVVVTTDKCYENKESAAGYTENDRLGGFDPYSNSKACAELAVAAYRNSFFADDRTLIATARAGNVIGGGDWSEDRLLPDVFRSLVFEKPLLIRSPNSIRPWQHVLEPLAGYLMLAEKLFHGERDFAEAWNFGPEDEDSKSVGWILDRIKEIWKEPVGWEIAGGEHPHETKMLKLSSAKAKSKLRWSPKLDLSEALDLTVDWYRNFKAGADLADFTGKQIEAYEKKTRGDF
jgi:CDP-glucose 4,6-dehydratase